MEKLDSFGGSGDRAMKANIDGAAEIRQRIQRLLDTGGSTEEINRLRMQLDSLKQDRGRILDADLPK